MKPENIKNSIIVSCRNSASWLPAQIEALVSQIRTDDSEILIIDNGSRDRTLSVAKRLRHSVPNLKVISADSRKGFAHARNVGAQNASGRFLLFCDGKDIVERDWIEKMSKALEKNPIVSGRLLTSEINPSWAIEAPPPEMRLEHSAVFKTFDHLPWASASNFGIHRKIFLKTGGFDERLTALEEVDFSWRLQKQGLKLTEVVESILHYRLRRKSIGFFHQAFLYSFNLVRLSGFHAGDGFEIPVSPPAARIANASLTVLGLFTFRKKFRTRLFWMLGWSCGIILGKIRFRRFGFSSLSSRLRVRFSRFFKPKQTPNHQPNLFS